MPKKIRIQRNTLNFRQASMKFVRLVEVCLGIYVKHAAMTEQMKATIQQARTEKIRKDTELAEMRRQKVCNDLVIQDLKIEELNRKAGHPVRPEWTDNNVP